MSEAQRVAIVTGAAGGIGRELVMGLLGRGIKVAAVDRTARGLAELAQAAQERHRTDLLNRPRRPSSRGFSPTGYPAKPIASYQIKPTSISMELSSTGDPRRRGALRNPG